MRLAIFGSRNWNDYQAICEVIREWKPDELVSGGARGADKLAERAAKEFGIPIKVFPADWDKYGKSAGYRRNAEIVAYADEGWGFWDGESKGTKHTYDLFTKAGKRCSMMTEFKETQNEDSKRSV